MSKEIKAASDAITVTNDCLAVGKVVFEKVATHLAVIAGVGCLVKDLMNIFKPGEPNPVMLKLNELEKKIDQLAEKMQGQFNDLKAFMAEHRFYAEIVQTASTLTKFMQDTISNPNHHSVGIFRDICQKKPPLQYAYRMITLLEQDSTNPLKLAMRADKLKKRATFEKWSGIIDTVLTQFLLLECYVNGLFWDSNMYGPEQLKKKIEDLNEKVYQWKEDYEGSYWPTTVERLVHETQDSFKNADNETKAEILKNDLESILTRDMFYIMVYNDCAGYDRHSFVSRGGRMICSFRRGSCNVVISRTSMGWIAIAASLDKFKRQVESCRHDTIPCRTHFDGFPSYLMDNRIDDAGFVGMIRDGNNLAVESVCKYGNSPGSWIKAHTSLHQNRRFYDGEIPAFFLICGLL